MDCIIDQLIIKINLLYVYTGFEYSNSILTRDPVFSAGAMSLSFLNSTLSMQRNNNSTILDGGGER